MAGFNLGSNLKNLFGVDEFSGASKYGSVNGVTQAGLNDLGLTSGMSSSDFASWYSDPVNAKRFDALSSTDQSLLGESLTGDNTNSGLGMNMGTLQAGVGLGNLGLGVAGYLDNKKTAKLQRGVLKQQLASNKDLMATRKARDKDIATAFGPKRPGLGA